MRRKYYRNRNRYRPTREVARLDSSTLIVQDESGNYYLRPALWFGLSAFLRPLRREEDGVKHYLSARPLDILTAGIFMPGVGAESCFNPNGCYKLAPSVILQSASTLIAYGVEEEIEDPTLKVWRTWVMFKNSDEFYIGRQYGQVNPAILRGLRRYIEMKLDNAFAGIQRFWRIEKDVATDYIITEGVHFNDVYYDKASQYVFATEKLRQELWDANLLDDNFVEILKPRADYTCTACDVELHEDEVLWVYDEPYCDNCFYTSFFYCVYCGEATSVDEGYEGPDGDYYCSWCADKLFVACEICGDLKWETDIVEVDNDFVCQDCYNEYYGECSECGEVKKKDKMVEIGGEWFCENCATELEEVGNA